MSEKFPTNEGTSTPSHEQLVAWGERFTESLQDALAAVQELEARVPIEEVLSSMEDERLFADLFPSEQSKLLEILESQLGVSQDATLKEYEMEGTPDSPGEGRIKIRVYGTNQEGVFVRKYTYADGSASYSVGPETLEDEENT